MYNQYQNQYQGSGYNQYAYPNYQQGFNNQQNQYASQNYPRQAIPVPNSNYVNYQQPQNNRVPSHVQYPQQQAYQDYRGQPSAPSIPNNQFQQPQVAIPMNPSYPPVATMPVIPSVLPSAPATNVLHNTVTGVPISSSNPYQNEIRNSYPLNPSGISLSKSANNIPSLAPLANRDIYGYATQNTLNSSINSSGTPSVTPLATPISAPQRTPSLPPYSNQQNYNYPQNPSVIPTSSNPNRSIYTQLESHSNPSSSITTPYATPIASTSTSSSTLPAPTVPKPIIAETLEYEPLNNTQPVNEDEVIERKIKKIYSNETIMDLFSCECITKEGAKLYGYATCSNYRVMFFQENYIGGQFFRFSQTMIHKEEVEKKGFLGLTIRYHIYISDITNDKQVLHIKFIEKNTYDGFLTMFSQFLNDSNTYLHPPNDDPSAEKNPLKQLTVNSMVHKTNELISIGENIVTSATNQVALKKYLASIKEQLPMFKRSLRIYATTIYEKQTENSSLISDLGLLNPADRARFNPKNYEENAQLIASLFPRLLEKCGGIIPVLDAYSYFCKAKMIDTMSPDDFIYLSQLSEGASLNTIASELHVPSTILQEFIAKAECSGDLCHDESVEGDLFYINVFKNINTTYVPMQL
ncbi:hypothetical protein WA158_005099 [Blastocystis sp. Blastoise]